MDEARTIEEQSVKKHNIEKGIEKEEKPIEKEIDGEVYVKKENVVVLKEAAIEPMLRTIFEDIRKGRTDKETVGVLRPIVKKLIYEIETTEEKKGEY